MALKFRVYSIMERVGVVDRVQCLFSIRLKETTLRRGDMQMRRHGYIRSSEGITNDWLTACRIIFQTRFDEVG